MTTYVQTMASVRYFTNYETKQRVRAHLLLAQNTGPRLY